MRPTFKGFDPNGRLRVYHRWLPHWRQDGATYFVTFRTADSIPRAIVKEWQDDRERFYRSHSIDVSRSEDAPTWAAIYRSIPKALRRKFEKEQARKLHWELDKCHGKCQLRACSLQDEVLQAFQFFHRDSVWLGDMVVMPNHIHVILQPLPGHDLEEVLGSVKKWVARKANDQERASSPFWQRESYDRIVRGCDELRRYRRYIAKNPVAAKLKQSEFLYYRAEWLDEYAVVGPLS